MLLLVTLQDQPFNLVRLLDSIHKQFLIQLEHFNSMFEMFKLNPSTNLKEFSLMITFLAHVSHCYVVDLKNFAADLSGILKSYSTVIHSEVRTSICKALVLLRNKKLLSSTDLLCTFFDLFLCQDKGLRGFLKYQIVNDIKTIVQKDRDMKKNAIVQSFIFNKLRESSIAMGKAAIDVMIALYRKNVWNDAKTVNKIAECCFSKHTKIAVSALSFFIGREDKDGEGEVDKKDSDSESEDEKDKTKAIRQLLSSNKVNKKTRKRKKMLQKTSKIMNADKRKGKAQSFNFSALHLIYDPQEMADRMLRQLEKSTERYEVKLMMMDMISRLIGVHQLMVLNFYSFIQRYLQPHQKDVTRILLFVSQSSHDLVLPDVLETLIKHIAFNFITERNSPECMAVGLNTVREVCTRCPLAMPQDLLHDFADYKNYNNKNVSMAAKSIIQLFRLTNPAMLKNRDRGPKTIASAELEMKEYGQSGAKDFLPGAELLPVEKESEQAEPEEERRKADQKALQNDDDDESVLDLDSDNWETEEEDDDDDKEDDEGSEDEQDEDEECAADAEQSGPSTSAPPKKEVIKTKEQRKSALRRSTLPKPEKEKETSESMLEVKERAAEVSSMRILDQEEFEKLRAIRLAKQVKASKSVNTKRKNDEALLESDLLQRKELVSLSAIERLYKRPKMSKEEREACGDDAPKGRKRVGRGEWRQNQQASKTEKERQRNKAFMMIKHKANRKKKNSFRNKQLQVKSALIKQLKAKKL
jgi:protein SDA1